MDRVEPVDVEGVDTERSRRGIAPRARDGDVLGDGDAGLCIGDVTLLVGGLISVSAMLHGTSRPLCSCKYRINET